MVCIGIGDIPGEGRLRVEHRRAVVGHRQDDRVGTAGRGGHGNRPADLPSGGVDGETAGQIGGAVGQRLTQIRIACDDWQRDGGAFSAALRAGIRQGGWLVEVSDVPRERGGHRRCGRAVVGHRDHHGVGAADGSRRTDGAADQSRPSVDPEPGGQIDRAVSECCPGLASVATICSEMTWPSALVWCRISHRRREVEIEGSAAGPGKPGAANRAGDRIRGGVEDRIFPSLRSSPSARPGPIRS